MKRAKAIDPGANACSNCRFWHEETEPADEARYGECRRRAPVVAAVDPEEGIANPMPLTAADFWCGEFERKVQ